MRRKEGGKEEELGFSLPILPSFLPSFLGAVGGREGEQFLSDSEGRKEEEGGGGEESSTSTRTHAGSGEKKEGGRERRKEEEGQQSLLSLSLSLSQQRSA